MNLNKRVFLQATAAAALVSQTGMSAAQDKKYKIGLLLPMTGPYASACTWPSSAPRWPGARSRLF